MIIFVSQVGRNWLQLSVEGFSGTGTRLASLVYMRILLDLSNELNISICNLYLLPQRVKRKGLVLRYTKYNIACILYCLYRIVIRVLKCYCLITIYQIRMRQVICNTYFNCNSNTSPPPPPRLVI